MCVYIMLYFYILGQNSENDILAMFSKQNEKITLKKVSRVKCG